MVLQIWISALILSAPWCHAAAFVPLCGRQRCAPNARAMDGDRLVPRRAITSGWFNTSQQQAHAARAVTKRQARGGDGAPSVAPAATVTETGAPRHKFFCEECSIGFSKRKNYDEHVAGRRHRDVVATADACWEEFRSSAWWAPEIPRSAVVRAWHPSELDALPRRSSGTASATSIDPGVTLSSLAPTARARLWRFLHDLMPHSPEIADIFVELESGPDGRFARVKEILEVARCAG